MTSVCNITSYANELHCKWIIECITIFLIIFSTYITSEYKYNVTWISFTCRKCGCDQGMVMLRKVVFTGWLPILSTLTSRPNPDVKIIAETYNYIINLVTPMQHLSTLQYHSLTKKPSISCKFDHWCECKTVQYIGLSYQIRTFELFSDSNWFHA